MINPRCICEARVTVRSCPMCVFVYGCGRKKKTKLELRDVGPHHLCIWPPNYPCIFITAMIIDAWNFGRMNATRFEELHCLVHTRRLRRCLRRRRSTMEMMAADAKATPYSKRKRVAVAPAVIIAIMLRRR